MVAVVNTAILHTHMRDIILVSVFFIRFFKVVLLN